MEARDNTGGERASWRDGVVAAAPPVALAVLSLLFRLPPLLNAAGTNSDAAIVGLQARHILRGETSWFLWGSGYQTSVDAFVAALFLALGGDGPRALMLSTLAGHTALTLLVWATLRRHLGAARAFVLALALVLTTSPVHTFVLYPPRQASLTLVFAAVWLLDGAPARVGARARLAYAVGAATSVLAVFADPYALLFVPALLLVAVLAAREGRPARAELFGRARALAAGAIVGAVPLAILVTRPRATSGPRGMTLAFVERNVHLLVTECLPWLLGAKVFRGSTVLDYGPWESPWLPRALGIAGAIAAVLALVAATAACAARATPSGVRRVGLFGLVLVPSTLAGFLGSVMVMDLFSARYLVAIALAFPLALAPLAARVTAKQLAALMAPYLVATAIGGWMGYGPYVRGPVPVVASMGAGEEDAALGAALRDRGVRYAVADYWTAYRLTFLFKESPIVVPLNHSEDRYPPYRDEFARQRTIAYLFDPARSREDRVATLAGLTSDASVLETLDVGRVLVVIVRRNGE